jgi:hypothetical protein
MNKAGGRRLRPKFESFEMTPLFIMTSDAI